MKVNRHGQYQYLYIKHHHFSKSPGEQFSDIFSPPASTFQPESRLRGAVDVVSSCFHMNFLFKEITRSKAQTVLFEDQQLHFEISRPETADHAATSPPPPPPTTHHWVYKLGEKKMWRERKGAPKRSIF